MQLSTKLKDSIIILILLLIAILCCLVERNTTKRENEIIIIPDSLDLTKLELTETNFLFVCACYEIDSPRIVLAQAKLESGYFTSRLYEQNNNFLGLYNSKTKSYYSFDHWSTCLKAYKEFVQYKWDGSCSYYDFLLNLPYAEDPHYIQKLKRLQ